jgi:hypothetical protein
MYHFFLLGTIKVLSTNYFEMYELGMMVHAYNFSIWDAEEQDTHFQGLPGLQSKTI